LCLGLEMKHGSVCLDWYVHVPKVRHDLRSSGLTSFKYDIDLGKVDLSANFDHGNSETAKLLTRMYHTEAENVIISSEGASGQNARIIRYVAERHPWRTEAIVEYPTHEPLLRQVQEYFGCVRRLERREKDGYRLDADALRKLVSGRTGLLMITNPHAPSGSLATMGELKDIMAVAREFGFFVVCDEIYAEFDRSVVPTIFSVDSEYGIVTTSFTKAFGLGGLKLGVALAQGMLVNELYVDVLNTVGNSPNVVQLLASEILKNGMEALERHKRRWRPVKRETEQWLDRQGIEYFPNKLSVNYWAKLPVKDTCRWIDEHAVPKNDVAPLPGAFFLFKSGCEIVQSNMVRIGLGHVNPEGSDLPEALEAMEKALETYCSTV